MKKAAAINTFEGGLLKDIQPLVTPNNVLCDALNATLITMQGNENVLQNDMGNGRVETAFLPEGYVPLGTASIGGIIYILSCNPLNGKCQIGSFPSPERNISSDEVSEVTQTLSNADFQFDENTGAGVYYVKKELNSDLVFNPGDKFIVYGDTIASNFEKFYDESKYTIEGYADAKKQTVKLSIGAVTDAGKLIVFNQLKKYKVGNKEFEIFEYNPKNNSGKPDLNDYRSIVSQPYNIFSSKVSGRLAIIAELIHCDTFSISIKNNFRKKYSYERFPNAVYSPSLTVKLSGESPFIPKGVYYEVQLLRQSKEGQIEELVCTSTYYKNFPASIGIIDYKQYQFTFPDFLQDNFQFDPGVSRWDTIWYSLKTLASNHNYFSKDRDPNMTYVYLLKYTITPIMNWGPVNYLAIQGSIDLDKLNTDEVTLTDWKYYKNTSTPQGMNITYGIQTYLQEYNLKSINILFHRIIELDSNKNIITDSSIESSSYIPDSSTFEGQDQIIESENLPFSNKQQNINGITFPKLVSDQLYLANIHVILINTEGQQKEVDFYRFMYTNGVFNEYWNDTTCKDYKDLNINLNATILENTKNFTSNIISTDYSYGVIAPSVEGLSEEEISELKQNIKSSLSCEQITKDTSLDFNVKLGLQNDYNMFKLQLDDHTVDLKQFNVVTYSKGDSPNPPDLLRYKSEFIGNKSTDSYKLPKFKNVDFSDQVFNSPTYLVSLINLNRGVTDNIYTFKFNFKELIINKAYCTRNLDPSTCTFTGVFKPLAYDVDTFKKYGLRHTGLNDWCPNTIIGYGFNYQSTTSSYVSVSHMTIYNYYRSPEWIHGNSTNNRAVSASMQWDNIVNTVVPNDFLGDMDYSNLVQYAFDNKARFMVHWYDAIGYDPITIKYENSDYDISYPLYNLKNGKTKARLTLMLSDGDDNFYPINFQSMQTYSRNPLGNTQYAEYDSIANSIVDNVQNKAMFREFASILNGLYSYKTQSTPIKYLAANTITTTNSQNELIIPINLKFNIQNDVLITLPDNTELVLKDIIQKFKDSRILSNLYDNDLIDNIKCNINNPSGNYNSPNTYPINISNYNGNQLKQNILSYIPSGYAVMDYNGVSLAGTVSTFEGQSDSAKQTKLYYFTGTNGVLSVNLAKNYNFPSFKYTKEGNNLYRKYNGVLDTINIDFNDNFKVDSNGDLVVKIQPFTDESTDRYKFVVNFPGNDINSDNDTRLLILGYYGDAKLTDSYTIQATEK